MPRYINADALEALFRDMAEFAGGKNARALREAADAVRDMPGEEVRPVKEGKWQLVCGFSRYLRCPFCGFETTNSSQPRNEGWLHCPGCGNICSMAGNKVQERVPPDDAVPSRNEEGYADPTAWLALKKISREEGRYDEKTELPVPIPGGRRCSDGDAPDHVRECGPMCEGNGEGDREGGRIR